MENQTAQSETPQAASEQSSAQTSVSQHSFTVPEAYAEKPWAKQIAESKDPQAEAWSSLDNLQGLLGKRAVPDADATPEALEKYYEGTRPKDGYKLPEVEGMPEGSDFTESHKIASEMFNKHGLTQKQAEGLYADWAKGVQGEMAQNGEKTAEQNAALDKEFEKVMTEQFGDGYEAVSTSVQEFVAANVPEELRGHFAKAADNPQLMAMFVASINAAQQQVADVKKKYGAEGELSQGEGATQGRDIGEVRRELAQIRISPEYKDFTHPDNKKAVSKVNELSAIVQRSLKTS